MTTIYTIKGRKVQVLPRLGGFVPYLIEDGEEPFPIDGPKATEQEALTSAYEVLDDAKAGGES